MNIACKLDSILSSCGIDVPCSKRHNFRCSDVAKNSPFWSVLAFYSIRAVTNIEKYYQNILEIQIQTYKIFGLAKFTLSGV